MNKPLSGWQLGGISVVVLGIGLIIKSNIVITIGDIFLVIAIIAGVRNHIKNRKNLTD